MDGWTDGEDDAERDGDDGSDGDGASTCWCIPHLA